MNFTKLGCMVFSRCLVVGWIILIAGVLNAGGQKLACVYFEPTMKPSSRSER
jgi:hypothetical protein